MYRLPVLLPALFLTLISLPLMPDAAHAQHADVYGYLMVEHDRNLDIDAIALGNLRYDGRHTTTSLALFTASDGNVVWSGAEMAAGLSLATLISPAANFGVVIGSPDDSTDGADGTFAGIEAFMEWGVTLRLGPLYGFAGRRNYYGHNGIERGERSDITTFGLRTRLY